MRNKHKQNNKLLIVIPTVAFLFIILGYGAYAYTQAKWPFEKPQNSGSNIIDGINYNPPTEQEIKDSQNGKKNNQPSSQESAGENTTNLRSIEVGVAFADYINDVIEIRAFTPSVVEGNGICTATLTRNDKVVTEQSKSFIDSSSSQCQPIKIPLNRFNQSGMWSLNVKYKSPTSIGASETIMVTVP